MAETTTLRDLWRPIAELENKYANNLLLRAPELLDLDFNEHGVGLGYWQDDRDEPVNVHGACGLPGVDYGGWLACSWDGTNDEWRHVPCTPTHFIVLCGPKAVEPAEPAPSGINPTPADVGRAVLYTAAHPGAAPEEGVITSYNEHTVFVRYGADKHSKGTDRRDLQWVRP